MENRLQQMRLYVDFDGFFAAVEEQTQPALRGEPIGVVPMKGADNTCVIAANPKAKAFGIKTGTKVWDARRLCPEVRLVPATQDLYLSVHRKIVDAVEEVIPVDAVCSVDEMCCTPSPLDRPERLAADIKASVRDRVGEFVTCSVGFAPGRLLAKIASEMDKPDGMVILRPEGLPGRLLDLGLSSLTGIGSRMLARLQDAGIRSVADLWNSEPIRLREIWGGVEGERFWRALHGFEVFESRSEGTKSLEHSRVLDPASRSPAKAYPIARLLAVKVARRLRRLDLVAERMSLSASLSDHPRFFRRTEMEPDNSDIALLETLSELWPELERHCAKRVIFKVRVSLDRLSPENGRQQSLFEEPSRRRRGKSLAKAMDRLNERYGRTVVGYGSCAHSRSSYTGAKIAFTRIPDERDFL